MHCATGSPLFRPVMTFLALAGLLLPAPPGRAAPAQHTPAQHTPALHTPALHTPALHTPASPRAPVQARTSSPQTLTTESWVYTGFTPMFMFGAIFRSQGIAYNDDDGTLLWSWQYGLQVTDTDYNSLVNVPTAIPAELRVQGSNHIGGIDYLNGRLYAPIEDGDRYQHPFVVLFDAQTLVPTGEVYELPSSLQPDGVPWIAIDEANQVIYSAPWNPVFALNVYDLHTLSYLGQLSLDITIGRIQGAKVRNGKLYASTDDATMTTYQIDLETGYVTPLFNVLSLPGLFPDDPFLEAQSLTFWDAPDGSSLHVQVIRSVYPNPDNPRKPFHLAPSTCLYHFKLQ